MGTVASRYRAGHGAGERRRGGGGGGPRGAHHQPDKVFFPERGETKLDLVRYYLAVEEPLHARDGRPPRAHAALPRRRRRATFFQKRVPTERPDWLQTTIVSTPNGTTSHALVAADLAHVVWAVNLGCLGFHVWPYLADDPDHADELRIDLDPQPGIGFPRRCGGRRGAGAARRARHRRRSPRPPATGASTSTSASQPRWDSYQVRAAAVAVARELERRRPDLITAAWWKEERGERVFIDFNQNAPHKTVFGAWSVRARAGAQVSTPLSWDELDDVDTRRAHDRDRAGSGRPSGATRGPR